MSVWRYYANQPPVHLWWSVQVVGCFELFRVMQLVPQAFHDEADQRIRSSIRKKNPRKAYRIVTKERNWQVNRTRIIISGLAKSIVAMVAKA
jgi:hypothetical protein